MNKILLIIQREYLSRVKKKSFLLTTFLVPLFFIGMYVGIFFLTKKSFEDSHATVYIIDLEGNIGGKLKSNKNITYKVSAKSLTEQMGELKDGEDNNNLLIIPQDFYSSQRIELLSAGKPNITTQSEVKNQLKDIIRNDKYARLGLDIEAIQNIDDKITVTAKEISDTGDAKESHTEVAMGIAMALSVLVYLSLFLYGAQVMRGIIEEKTSRIVEVVISSVKPFQLMMGKIIGIGLVGITQFLLWIILSIALTSVATAFIFNGANVQTELLQSGIEQDALTKSEMGFDMMTALDSVNFPLLLSCFFIFFLGGYFLYSALFAAVGSAVDSETEASQFTMPITMPLLLTYILSFGVLVNDPNGAIATWLSFIPFTSPIAMLVRIPFGVPTWQIIVSVVLLISGFLVTTFIAARIYRVGILMYGKKASFKELIKWFRYKS
ncbi:ABC transporter permease [Sphingobacterium psychroaquaticum]|uniref:ABC transporter permease n=1 Tax=Sphingobacterium psychroaquaticum TaxID=561061 RepID=UPI0010694F75|nr:ABC transporter permease [Sphingobacterium psychroaquaticum]QBQ41461.1 ABC transporter permease [Sphingobacterium psychroaquaticum]